MLAADLLEAKTLSGLANLVTARPTISKTPLDHEPFSLCEKSILPIVREELAHVGGHDNIVDILPTTMTQNFFLTQWSLSGYCCMLNGLIDPERLTAACSAVVHRHSILRTVFTRLPEHGFVQVVLRKFDPELECRRIVDEDLAEICSSAVENLITETAPAVGKQLIRFILLSKSDRQHALLVRVSHAQYDGNTSPLLFRDISTVYNNYEKHSGSALDILPAATPFQNYLYTRNNSRISPEDDPAMKFWRQNLQGASITTLTTALKDDMGKPESHIRIITAPAIGPLPIIFDNITVPTLLNAACSLLLADLVCQNDIVFGNVMDTRGAVAYPGIETTLGPCLNINPLRARLEQRDTMTFADLCHSIGEQYARAARHSTTWDLSDIVKHCTDWPADTQIGCILNHLRPDSGPPPLQLDGVDCVSLKKSVQINLPHQLLFRCIAGPDKLEVQVLTSTALMDQTMATRLSERLVAGVRVLSEAPRTLLSDVCI